MMFFCHQQQATDKINISKVDGVRNGVPEIVILE